MDKIRQIIGRSKVVGDVGIEIEMEAARRLPSNDLPDPWIAESDGSLRGYSMEYITRGPIPISKVTKHVDSLGKLVAPSNVNHSFRAGVHVHVNVQEMTMPQVGNMAAVYWCLESALMKFCGSNREGNHFCLRLRDAQYPLDCLLSALQSGEIYSLDTDSIRYSAMNLRAIATYGSVEFRGMETLPDLSKIPEWAKILVAIREYSKGVTHRQEIAYQLSADGPENWVRSIIGGELFSLIDYENFQKDVMSCMRLVQPLIYQRSS